MSNSYQAPMPPTGPTQTSGGTATGLGDLAQPLPGASIKQALGRFFKKYAVFTGRASRSEFWWVYLVVGLLSLIPTVLMSVGLAIGAVWAANNANVHQLGYDSGTGEPITVETAPGVINHPPAAILVFLGLGLLIVLFLAVIVPMLALGCRRLHDANLAGPMLFIVLVPFVGSLIVLILMLLPPKPEGARFDAIGPQRG